MGIFGPPDDFDVPDWWMNEEDMEENPEARKTHGRWPRSTPEEDFGEPHQLKTFYLRKGNGPCAPEHMAVRAYHLRHARHVAAQHSGDRDWYKARTYHPKSERETQEPCVLFWDQGDRS